MRASLVLAAALTAAANAQGDVKLDNAWMRPAYAGQPHAAVYVDIRAPEPLRLVGASSPVANRAELVRVEPPSPDPAQHRVVPDFAIAGGGETRLAYLGNHIRLVDVRREVAPNERVPVELVFVDAAGKRRMVAMDVLVRGLTARRPEPEPALPPK